jgi:hypothetical protein
MDGSMLTVITGLRIVRCSVNGSVPGISDIPRTYRMSVRVSSCQC